MGLGFALPVLHSSMATRLTGGLFTGLSIGAMHFTGMAAMRAAVQMRWDWAYVAASMIIGGLGAMVAFEARGRLKGRPEWLVPAALLLLAVVGLHFTAMTAVVLTPDPRIVMPADMIGRGTLAAATGGLAGLIFLACLSLIGMERLGHSATLRGLRQAIDAVPAGLAFYDHRGQLVSCNRATAELMARCGLVMEPGVRRQAVIEAARQAGWRLAAGADDAHWRALMNGGAVGAAELVLPDGRIFVHEAFRTDDGGGVSVLTDVTEQRETARVMAEARDAAEAANRAKSEFLANMSHELRTPLNGMMGVAQVLEGTKLADRQRELLGVLRNSGAMLNALLSDLLDLARVEAGVVELRPEPTDVAALVATVRDLFTPAAREKGLTLRAAVDPTAGHVDCDPVRLRQVLGNLVSNAVKFTDKGRVEISVIREADTLRFAVRDTGPGFDEAQKTTLFQRFRQGDGASTRAHGGAGLGLAICDQLVRLMGGALDCQSRPGHGATFAFTLNLPRSSADAAPASLLAPAPSPEPVADFRVLVVDDNAVNRQVLELILDSAGVAHAAVENGQEAVEAAQRVGFDVILMDIQMPVMDGFEATRRIRKWERAGGRPRTPIYIVSANCLTEHVEAGRRAGSDGHLNKPISVPELLAALEPHVAPRRAA
jgi:signal transduction histidine kinase/ActR/RegA family two-component response regulator